MFKLQLKTRNVWHTIFKSQVQEEINLVMVSWKKLDFELRVVLEQDSFSEVVHCKHYIY